MNHIWLKNKEKVFNNWTFEVWQSIPVQITCGDFTVFVSDACIGHLNKMQKKTTVTLKVHISENFSKMKSLVTLQSFRKIWRKDFIFSNIFQFHRYQTFALINMRYMNKSFYVLICHKFIQIRIPWQKNGYLIGFYHSQAFIATLLFDPSMSTVPIIVEQNHQLLVRR